MRHTKDTHLIQRIVFIVKNIMLNRTGRLAFNRFNNPNNHILRRVIRPINHRPRPRIHPPAPAPARPPVPVPTSTSTTTTVTVPEEIITTTTVDESISNYTEEIRYLRSRNIEFDANGLKPVTRFYAFFEGVDVSKYIIPKLLEIEMVSGKFEIGEIVRSAPISYTTPSTGGAERPGPETNKIVFRTCAPNHKKGPSDGSEPTIVQVDIQPEDQEFEVIERTPSQAKEIYKLNPYTQKPIEENYTSSSTLLNVDTFSLQLPSEDRFYGCISPNMTLIGETSGAVARIKNIRLVSDSSGRLIGSLFIPRPDITENPKWINGQNTVTLIDTPVLNNLDELFDEFIANSRVNESSAESDFTSSGSIFVTQIDVLTTRNTTILSDFNINTTTITNTNPIPVPVPVPARAAEARPRRRRRGGGRGRGRGRGRRHDPIAQSFYVEDPNGIFLTAVDIFFETKDEELPVTLQVRTMEAGVPSNVVLPFSEVTLTPDKITELSTDGSAATTITFPSPIYLSGPPQREVRGAPIANQEGVEYAIVLLSNSPNYRVFVSELGQRDLLTGERINIQPTLGSFFKSQTGTTWSPAQLEDLKYRIYRADFVNEGLVRFFNPKLSLGNDRVTVTKPNDFLPLSKRIVVGLGSTGYNSSSISKGVTIKQGDASGKLIGIGGNLITTGIAVTGVGYTNGVFTGVSLESETGYGKGAIASIEIVNSGISEVVITSGGFGYQVGDSLIIPEKESGLNVGFGGKLVVTEISNKDTAFVLDNVQGSFSVGITSLSVVTSAGSTVSTGATISSITLDPYYDGRHMKINHINHGMHSTENFVRISDVRPPKSEVNSTLTQTVDLNETIFPLVSSSGFEVFEGKPVNSLNPGYAIIGNEVLKYTSISGQSLIVTERLKFANPGLTDPSVSIAYPAGTVVRKYEFNGISLKRINKIHNFAEVDVANHPIEFNSYHIKIDTSDADFDNVGIGSDRPDLYFTETIQTGEPGAVLTNNIQFEQLTPNIAHIIPGQTSIDTRVRTFTGTSISGNEDSFVDSGYRPIGLQQGIDFDRPMLICSDVNESRFINESPGNKSFTMEFVMKTNDSRVSPVIDLIRTNVVLTSNLINAPLGVNETSTYADDDTVRSLESDKHAAIYISNTVRLQLPANSLKVFLTGIRNSENDIRVLYQLIRDDAPDLSSNYELFPGFSNYQVDGQGIKRVIDKSKNDGSADSASILSDEAEYQDYEYSVDDLPEFNAFAIKIVLASKNQAKPPAIQGLRAIATVKPKV